MANVVNPADYLPSEQSGGLGTPDEQQQHHFDQVAAGLGRRAQLRHELSGVTDEDLDSNSYDERTAQGESLLNSLIAKAAKATDPAERALYNKKAEQVAQGLVTGQQSKPQLQEQTEASAFEQLTSKGIDVRGVMEWAGQELAESSIDGFDELIKGKDQQLAFQTVQLLDHAKGRPDQYVHNDSDWEVPSDDYWMQFIDEFGEEPIRNLQTVTLAIKNGITTPAKAFELYQKDEPTKRAMLTLMARNQIRMVI